MAVAAQPDDTAILQELEDLLCDVAAGGPVNRAESTRYSNGRTRLIASPVRRLLPGFLHQCVSLLRYKEFITLYDPNIGERQRFVRRRLEPCREQLGVPRRAEGERPGEPQSQHWML